MSREKQVEEMAKISCNTNNSEIKWECANCPFNTVCDIQISCEAIYNAGYRKQSEGEWKGNGYLKHCSECGNVVNFNNVSRWLYNFCPNCGAKMKGGEE